MPYIYAAGIYVQKKDGTPVIKKFDQTVAGRLNAHLVWEEYNNWLFLQQYTTVPWY